MNYKLLKAEALVGSSITLQSVLNTVGAHKTPGERTTHFPYFSGFFSLQNQTAGYSHRSTILLASREHITMRYVLFSLIRKSFWN